MSSREKLINKEVRINNRDGKIVDIIGKRPVMIIQNNLGNKYSPTRVEKN